MPAKKDPIQISGVKFTTVFLFPNGQKKIEVIDFLKNYLQTDSENPKQASSREYKVLITYFDSLLKKKSKTTGNFEDDYSSRQGRLWFKDNVKYVLVRTKLKKAIGSFRYMLDLSYTLIE